MFKYILLLIIGIFCFIRFGVQATDNNFYNYSFIEDTAILNFNGEENGTSYKVSINTGEVYYATGLDGGKHQCFNVEGTGYTDTMGEVYFDYDGQKSLICSDGHWRGYAKLGAGGWIDFEDIDLSDGTKNWNAALNKNESSADTGFYYHSFSGNDIKTGLALTDGVGLWNWSEVKTKLQVRENFLDHISTSKSNIYVSTGIVADGREESKFNLNLKDGSGNDFKNIWIDSISLYTGNSDFVLNSGDTGVFFTGVSDSIDINNSLSTGSYNTGLYSVFPGTGTIAIKIGVGGESKIITGYADFQSPITGNLDIVDTATPGKQLIGDIATGEVVLNYPSYISNISNFNGNILLSGNKSYNTTKGKLVNQTNYKFPIKFLPKFDEVDSKLGVSYNLNTHYDISVNGKTFTGIDISFITNKKNFYPNKEINKIKEKTRNCSNIEGNGSELCNISFRVLNNKGYGIPNISFDMDISDGNRSTTQPPHNTFDLDEVGPSYKSGLFLTGSYTGTNSNGLVDLSFYSYKPVYSGKVDVNFKNITGSSNDIYNWYQSNKVSSLTGISFNKVVNLTFTGAAVDDGVVLGQDKSLEIVYSSGSPSVVSTNGYELSGSINGCSDCVFSGGVGAKFTGNSFGNKNGKIYISGSTVPRYVSYYDTSYEYDVNGRNGQKTIKLSPNVKINGELSAVTNFFGMNLIGLANRAYSYLTLNTKSNISVVGSDMPFSSQVNKVRTQIERNIRGVSPDNVFDGTTGDINSLDNKGEKYYKCKNGGNIKISISSNADKTYQGENKLILINCPLYINSDIVKKNKNSSLKIYSIDKENNFIDYASSNGWKMNSNIYVDDSVDRVFASIFTNGSILLTNSSGKTLISDRWRYDNSLKNQIYWKGRVMGRNTLGGGFISSNNKVTLPGGSKEYKSNPVFGTGAKNVAQMYDINFWRGNYVKNDGTYNTGNVSEYIYNNYNCDGTSSSDFICKRPVVLEHDKN